MAYLGRYSGIADIDELTPGEDAFIVGTGTDWVTLTGALARAALGLGSGDDVTFHDGIFSSVDIATTGATTGTLTQAGDPLLHTIGTDSVYLGTDVANLTDAANAANNAIVGVRAFQAAITANKCAALGTEALQDAAAAVNSTAVGYRALIHNLASGTTAVGSGAGLTHTNQSECVFIGNNAGGSNDNLVNAIAIGSGAVVATSNTMCIGTGATQVSVGIGVQPSFRLHVNGIISANTQYNVGTVKVVGNRVTGWAVPTGTSSRATFDTATVTHTQLAEVVKALKDDLTAHGLIGA